MTPAIGGVSYSGLPAVFPSALYTIFKPTLVKIPRLGCTEEMGEGRNIPAVPRRMKIAGLLPEITILILDFISTSSY